MAASGPDSVGWGQAGGGQSQPCASPAVPVVPNPGQVPGRCQDAAGGSAGEQPAMREPLSRFLSQRVGRSRCGQRCPLTVTFKGLFPPAHEPQRSQPPATGPVPAGGRGGRIRPGSPLLTPGPGCRRQRGGPLGLARSSCPPPGVAPFPGPLCPVAVQDLAVGPSSAAAQPHAPCSARAGWGSPRPQDGSRTPGVALVTSPNPG